MAGTTREQFLDTAEALFAERGFYGASIAAIADQLGLTKQALLHHFGSKEKLYGAVLKRISERFEVLEGTPGDGGGGADATARLVRYLSGIQAAAVTDPDQTRLLMRELLDNKRRADTAGTWYLKAFLERLIGMVQAVPGWTDVEDAVALALVYQWLGAINYFAVSGPTLTGIFGPETHAGMAAAYAGQLEQIIMASLAAGSASPGQ